MSHRTALASLVLVAGLAGGAAPVAAAVPVGGGGDPVSEALADRDLAAVKVKVKDGEPPTFSWTRVRGASTYLVSVRTKKGSPLWAWSGEETKVRLGDGLGLAGPRITAPSVVQVFALDADGALVGFSKPVAIR